MWLHIQVRRVTRVDSARHHPYELCREAGRKEGGEEEEVGEVGKGHHHCVTFKVNEAVAVQVDFPQDVLHLLQTHLWGAQL